MTQTSIGQSSYYHYLQEPLFPATLGLRPVFEYRTEVQKKSNTSCFIPMPGGHRMTFHQRAMGDPNIAAETQERNCRRVRCKVAPLRIS